uniref:Uncharacterized protein n=1 Tax=Cucumis melo TaxID=3656 RepID=A0A9I9EAW0_CUCME
MCPLLQGAHHAAMRSSNSTGIFQAMSSMHNPEGGISGKVVSFLMIPATTASPEPVLSQYSSSRRNSSSCLETSMMSASFQAFLMYSRVSSRDFHNGNGKFKSKKISPPNFLDNWIALKSVGSITVDNKASELKWKILACDETYTISLVNKSLNSNNETRNVEEDGDAVPFFLPRRVGLGVSTTPLPSPLVEALGGFSFSVLDEL